MQCGMWIQAITMYEREGREKIWEITRFGS